MKRPVIALVVAGLLLATAGSTALAKTTKIEVMGTASPTAEPVPGTMTTYGNIVVMRGFKDSLASQTNNPMVTGQQQDVVNWIGDTKANRGVLWGTGVHQTEYPGGIWHCSFVGMFADFAQGAWSGKGACHGAGTLEGWQWIADISSTQGGGLAMHGYIFFPGQ